MWHTHALKEPVGRHALSIRQHTSACVGIRQHTPTSSVGATKHMRLKRQSGDMLLKWRLTVDTDALQKKEALDSCALHTSAYVSMRRHTEKEAVDGCAPTEPSALEVMQSLVIYIFIITLDCAKGALVPTTKSTRTQSRTQSRTH
jgi:hypothetical protein